MWTHFQGEEARKSPASRAKKRLSSSLSSKRGSGENFLLERKNLKWDSGGLNNELNWDRWLWIRLERKFRLSIRPHSERPNLGESLTKSLWRPSRHLLCWPYLLSLASAAWIKEDHAGQGISSCAKACNANELGWHSSHAQVWLSPHTEKGRKLNLKFKRWELCQLESWVRTSYSFIYCIHNEILVSIKNYEPGYVFRLKFR